MVLPLVPVTPITAEVRGGVAVDVRRHGAEHVARVGVDEQRAAPRAGREAARAVGVGEDRRRRRGRAASAAKSAPCARAPGSAAKRSPGWTSDARSVTPVTQRPARSADVSDAVGRSAASPDASATTAATSSSGTGRTVRGRGGGAGAAGAATGAGPAADMARRLPAAPSSRPGRAWPLFPVSPASPRRVPLRTRRESRILLNGDWTNPHVPIRRSPRASSPCTCRTRCKRGPPRAVTGPARGAESGAGSGWS